MVINFRSTARETERRSKKQRRAKPQAVLPQRSTSDVFSESKPLAVSRAVASS